MLLVFFSSFSPVVVLLIFLECQDMHPQLRLAKIIPASGTTRSSCHPAIFSKKTTHTPAIGFLWIFGPSTGVQVDLPIAVDVCCAPIVVPDDASVPDAPASEPSEAAEAAPVEAEAVPEAAPEAAPAVGGPKAISGCPVVSIFPSLISHAESCRQFTGACGGCDTCNDGFAVMCNPLTEP